MSPSNWFKRASVSSLSPTTRATSFLETPSTTIRFASTPQLRLATPTSCPCWCAALRISTKASIEQELGIVGQLDMLLRAGKITQPMSARDQRRLFWIAYATFPDDIKRFVIPKGRILLGEFAFDKSLLTDSHVAKIGAIARHCVAISRFISVPPKIAIAGHTDDRGTERYNTGLGERRAAAVNEALRRAIDELTPGLSKQMSITLQAFGETRPLVKARTEGEHARNRRVEVLLQQPLRRCTRVSLRAVVSRSLKLLPRLGSRDQAQRIGCMLRKMLQKGADDRWVFTELVSTVENKTLAFGTYPFGATARPLEHACFRTRGVGRRNSQQPRVNRRSDHRW